MPELWACSSITDRNLVYYSTRDESGKVPGYSCVRINQPDGVSNSGMIRLAKLLLKFDGFPVP